MKKVLAVLAIAALAATPAQAENFGSLFGATATAQTIAKGHSSFGGRLGFADAKSFIGTYGYGFSKTGDTRIKAAFVGDEFIGSELALGADVKWQLWDVYAVNSQGQVTRTQHPLDLSIGPFIEYLKVDYGNAAIIESQSVIQWGAQVTGSYPIRLKAGGSLSPYGRFNVRQEAFSMDINPAFAGTIDDSDSQIAAGFNGGVAWRPRGSTVALYGEFQIDGNNGVFLGIDYLL